MVVTLYLALFVKWPTKKQLHSFQQFQLAKHTHSVNHFLLRQSTMSAGDQRPLLKKNEQVRHSHYGIGKG